MFWLEASRPQTVDWLDLDRTAVLTRHEWWRPLTALFLHADVGHVISNLVSGAFVFSAVTTTLGRRRGWLLLGIAAVVGNVISVLCHPGEYRSLGASTAIFGALGLLTGHAIAWARGLAPGQRWQAAMLPLVSGIVVLALYGAGGPTIDVGAHVCGFVCGALLGPFATHGSVRSGDSSH
jgi:membrane associated rhomboid family serine protease